ncbi:hypothetical protein BY996DRAFT_889096 [Phakopsora pachyrhizi]|nr:hypothetical protein BY996DRAFT_889096 [Phakopsora pachyrhizi]
MTTSPSPHLQDLIQSVAPLEIIGTPGMNPPSLAMVSSILGKGPHNDVAFPISPDNCHLTEDTLYRNRSNTPECEFPNTPFYFGIDSSFSNIAQIQPNSFIPEPFLYSSSISSGSSRPCTAEYDEKIGSINGDYQPGIVLLGSDTPLSTISPFISDEKDGCTSPSLFYDFLHVPSSNSPNDTCLIPGKYMKMNTPVNGPNSAVQDFFNPESTPLSFSDPFSPHLFQSEQAASVSTSLFNTTFTESASWYDAIPPNFNPQLEGALPSSEHFASSCSQPDLLLCDPLCHFRGNQLSKGVVRADYEKKATYLGENCKKTSMTDQVSRIIFENFTDSKKSCTGRRASKNRSGPTCSDNGTRLKVERQLSHGRGTRQPSQLGPCVNKAETRPFVCEFILPDMKTKCGSRFQRSEHLKRHSATHKNEKNHQCPICLNFFGRTDNLQQHIKTHSNSNGRNSKLLRAKEEKLKAGIFFENRARSSKKRRKM